ncbi:hypothetical protein T10_10722 [Trichinella papuae]|uniref:Uncharacterized protein n=1 Tax=Trichinella papuae TaxID=268474 RepID=A0A0V1N1Z7_9BILA|nr:hypothetical protein T10_10722 [Trichinella papuae]
MKPDNSGFVVRNLEGRKPDHEETKREPVNTSSEQKLAQPNLIATADEQNASGFVIIFLCFYVLLNLDDSFAKTLKLVKKSINLEESKEGSTQRVLGKLDKQQQN